MGCRFRRDSRLWHHPRKRFRYPPGMESCRKRWFWKPGQRAWGTRKGRLEASRTIWEKTLCSENPTGGNRVYTRNRRRTKKFIPVKTEHVNMRETPAEVSGSIRIFLFAFLYIWIFFWLGSVLIANPENPSVPLQLPQWSDAIWWMGRPDTGWYWEIIEQGYEQRAFSADQPANWAFFPAYPLLVKLLTPVLSLNSSPSALEHLAVGWVLSVTFYFLLLLSLWILLSLDFDNETVFRSGVLLAFYPFSYGMAAFGPDSLALLCVCVSLYCARRESWLWAGLLGAVASATRAQGILLAPVLAYLYFRSRRDGRNHSKTALFGLALAPSGLLLFMAFLYQRTGNPFAFLQIQSMWENAITYPFSFAVKFFREPSLVGNNGWNPELLSVLFTASVPVILLWAWKGRKMPREYLLFFALQMLVLISRESTLGNLRYLLGNFPYFLALGILTKNTQVFTFILVLFAGFLGLFAALFASGYRVAAF